MPFETFPFGAAQYLDTPEAQAELLADAFESDDVAYIAQALGTIARALSELAREAGLTRQGLYKALSEQGDPRLSTLLGVGKALGYHLTVQPVTAS